AAEHVRIGEDAALVIQEKCVATRARRKLLDVIGRHRVQQARPVLTGELDFAARGEVHPGGAISECVVTRHFQIISGTSASSRRRWRSPPSRKSRYSAQSGCVWLRSTGVPSRGSLRRRYA